MIFPKRYCNTVITVFIDRFERVLLNGTLSHTNYNLKVFITRELLCLRLVFDFGY